MDEMMVAEDITKGYNENTRRSNSGGQEINIQPWTPFWELHDEGKRNSSWLNITKI